MFLVRYNAIYKTVGKTCWKDGRKKKLSTQNLILGERIFQNTSQINSLQNTQRLKVLFLPNELRRRKDERECVSGRRKPAADGNHHVYKE